MRNTEKIADIGYKYVQVSGTCTYDAEWLKSRLRENGLKCVLTHTPPKALKGDVQKVIKDHDILDCSYVGLGFFSFDVELDNYETLSGHVPNI